MWNEKPLIPNARKLSDLFASIATYRTPPRGETCGVHPRDGRKLTVSHYASAMRCDVKGVFGLNVTATAEVLDAIDRHMLIIDHDTIFFEILITSDGKTARVFAKYGQIIGSWLLAEFPTTRRKLAAQLPKERD